MNLTDRFGSQAVIHYRPDSSIRTTAPGAKPPFTRDEYSPKNTIRGTHPIIESSSDECLGFLPLPVDDRIRCRINLDRIAGTGKAN